MTGDRERLLVPRRGALSPQRKSVAAPALLLVLGLTIAWSSHVVFALFGPDGFVLALGLAVGLAIYAIVSFRDLTIPFVVWLVVVGGFRFLWAIQTPVLPDMTLDRITMIWLLAVLMVKFVVQRQGLRRFGTLDILLIVHCAYLLVRVILDDMLYFRVWSMSFLIPYATYFFAKNIVIKRKSLDAVLMVMLILSIYYNVTAVAEKLRINWLLWPPYMRVPDIGFLGRSSGPFRQAPLFGTIIGMMLPLHLYYITKYRSVVARILLFVSFNIGLAALYFTYTRGSWLAGAMALLTVAYLNRARYLPIFAGSLAVATIVAIAVLGIGQDEFMKRRVEQENTIESRLGIAATALRAWQSEPIFGIGFFRYRTTREEFFAPTTVPGFGTIRQRQVRGVSLHDIYLGPLAEDGLVGFALQTAIYVLIFRGLRRRRATGGPDDEFARIVLPVFAGMYVGYLVGGTAIDYRYFSFVGALFYMAAGIQDGYDSERGGLSGDPAADGAR